MRATSLLFIVGLHGALLLALVALGGPRTVMHRLASLEVHFVPPRPQPAAPVPARTLPEPPLRRPQPVVPNLPPIEIAIAAPVEPVSPPVDARGREPGPATPARPPRVAGTPPAESVPAQPPRFDLAYLRNPAPAYPPLSRRLKEEGRVLLRVRVDPDGGVQSIELAASSGHPRLDQAALAAVRQWRFSPARAGDVAVADWAVVPIVFELNA